MDMLDPDHNSPTPFLDAILSDAILGRDKPPVWNPEEHRRLVSYLWGNAMPSPIPSSPVKPFDTAAEADEFHADVAAWLKEQQ